MYDSPTINGYTFKHPPKPSNVYWEPQIVTHQLSDGTTVTYNKGYILKVNLTWGEHGWIDQDDYSNICVMFTDSSVLNGQPTATCHFYPRPNTYPSRKFNVQLTNFRFVPHGGDLQQGQQFYEGYVHAESSIGEITATATPIF